MIVCSRSSMIEITESLRQKSTKKTIFWDRCQWFKILYLNNNLQIILFDYGQSFFPKIFPDFIFISAVQLLSPIHVKFPLMPVPDALSEDSSFDSFFCLKQGVNFLFFFQIFKLTHIFVWRLFWSVSIILPVGISSSSRSLTLLHEIRSWTLKFAKQEVHNFNTNFSSNFFTLYSRLFSSGAPAPVLPISSTVTRARKHQQIWTIFKLMWFGWWWPVDLLNCYLYLGWHEDYCLR